jgi:peptide-methionine (S)-S-oxide reductase
LFWRAHDPTTLNRQGNDEGTQYRSVIFYHSPGQKIVAEESRRKAQSAFGDPIVTEIQPIMEFYKAENYHQQYYQNNASQPYCRFVIKPKLDKIFKK